MFIYTKSLVTIGYDINDQHKLIVYGMPYFKENHADYSVKCKIIYHSILSISNAMMPQMTEKKTQSSKESSKVQDFSSVYLYRYFNEVEFLQHKSEAFYCLTTFLP